MLHGRFELEQEVLVLRGILCLTVAPHLDAVELALRPFATRHDDVLTPRLGGFLNAHPQLEINLQSFAGLIDFQRDTGVDAALRIGQGTWPGLVSEHVFDEWVAPVASPELVARFGGLPTVDELSQWPLLGDPDRGDLRNAWFARFGGQPPERYVAYFDDSEALHRGAAAGVGLALGKLTRARLLLESGQLVQLSPARLRTDYAHYLVYPPRSADHAGLQTFRAWLVDHSSEYATRQPQMDAPAKTRKMAEPVRGKRK